MVKNYKSISPAIRRAIFERDLFTCKHCKIKGFPRKRPSKWFAYPTEIYGLYLTIDHIVAKSKGGGNEYSNIQTLCHDCNRLKKDK